MDVEKFIQKLTKKAGKELLYYFKKENKLISLRGTSKQIVTKYDKIIDRLIVCGLKKNCADHSMTSGVLGHCI